MDPLSVSASIAGLVTLADLVFRATLRYSKSVKGAPKEVKDLLTEVKDLSLLLHNLSMVSYGLEVQSSPQNGTAPPKPHHLHECRQLLRRLESGLPKFEGQSGLGNLQSRLKWPFSTSDTKEMLQAIGRHKQTINIALAADSISKLQISLSRQEEMNKEIQDLRQDIRKVLDIETKISVDQRRQEVLKSFVKANPRYEFETNKRLRHPMTALWLTESTEFEDWFSTEKARIWCSGIPGAGKSVIASAIIDECLQRIQSTPNAAAGYFFCTYRNPLTSLPSNILSALCYQLALQSEAAYRLLEAYYDNLHSAHLLPAQPDISTLERVLHQICAAFDRVYLIVDGLDECGTNTEATVASFLSISLAAANTNINLALLSRDEFPIRVRMEPHFHWIEIEAHTEDVQLYVASEIDRLIDEKKFRLRDMTLKDEIMARLVKGAKGMFRWVTCQLDHLCELPTDRARREALSKLPPTLPATYERILSDINTHSDAVQRIVRRSLLLVSQRYLHISSRAFCEAISIPTSSDRLDEDEIVDEQEVLRWCGSLVRMSPSPVFTGQRFEFAHYTVQEFLETRCQNHPTLSAYEISQAKSNDAFMRLALRYLTLKNFKRLPHANQSEVQHILKMRELRPFYEVASIDWPVEALVETNNSTANQLYTLFDIKKTPNFCTWAVEVILHCLYDSFDKEFCFQIRPDFVANDDIALQIISAVLRPDFTPLHMAAAWGLSSVCRHLLDNGARINLMSRYGTPLQCAVGGLSVFSDVQIVPEMLSDSSFQWLLSRSFPLERQNTVKLLLEAGSQVDMPLNTPSRVTSLLSLAVLSASEYDHDLGIIANLISSGVLVEEEDLPNFTHSYSIATRRKPHVFKRFCNEGKAILNILDALIPLQPFDASQRPEVRLYNMTLILARTLELDVPKNLTQPTMDSGMSLRDFRAFLFSAIQNNDIAFLESLPSYQHRKVVEFIGLDPGRPGWTPLHIAVWEQSLDSVKVLLEWGCDPNSRDDDGKTPVHLCCDDQHEEYLRTLLRHGANHLALDGKSQTIWHLGAEKSAVRILKLLIQQDDKDSALQIVSGEGDTPMCRALTCGQKQSTLLLINYCGTKQHWKSSKSIYRAAGVLGSSRVVQKLLSLGVEHDGVDESTGNPLHFVNSWSDPECVEQLKTIYSCHQRRKADLATPFELLLQRVANDKEDPPLSMNLQGVLQWPSSTQQCDAAMRLCPDSMLSSHESSCNMWTFLCTEIIPVALILTRDRTPIEDICSTLLDRGIAKLYEEYLGTSSLSPLVTGLYKRSHTRLKSVTHEGQRLVRFAGWTWFAETFRRLSKDTKYRNGVMRVSAMGYLLYEAIVHADQELVVLLVESGVNCHSKVDMMTPFELACLPNSCDHDEILGYLLGYTNAEILREPCSFGKGLGPLHLIAGFGTWTQGGSLGKLQRLLQAGADPNLPSDVQPPMVHHIRQGSLETAEALLDLGADPWLHGAHPFDSALAAIASHNSSLLQKIMEHSISRGLSPQWGRTWTGFNQADLYRGLNALHLAAQFDEVECLKFYLDQQRLTDLEVRDSSQETPMHHAARHGFSSVINFLVGRGGKINTTSTSGMTPLHLAVQRQQVHAVNALLKHGAVQQACHAGCLPIIYAYDTGNTTIISALQTHLNCSATDAPIANIKGLRRMADTLSGAIKRNDIDACKRIHSLGCPVDIEVNPGMTPLLLALYHNSSECLVQWLIDTGAKVSTLVWHQFQSPPFGGHYLTALHIALRYPIFNTLLKTLVTKYLDEGGEFPVHLKNPLVMALQYRNTEGLSTLLKVLENSKQNTILYSLVNRHFDEHDNRGPLHLAAKYDDLDAVKALVDSGADIEGVDRSFATPLHFAARHEASSVVDYLIASGVGLDRKDCIGRIPLLSACGFNSFSVIEPLAETFLTHDTTDDFGNNALCTLVSAANSESKPPNVEAFKLLVDRGVNPFARNKLGVSAAQLMLVNNSTVYLRHTLNRFPRFFNHQTFLWPSGFVWCFPKLGTVTLTCISRSLRIVRRYVDFGQFLHLANLSNPGEHSFFCQAACWGLTEAVLNFLKAGADVEHPCHEHGTPLVAALAASQFDVVKLLVRKGAKLIPVQLSRGGVNLAKVDDKIRGWLMVGRYLDQAKLTTKAWDEHRVPTRWAGVVPGVVEVEWHWKQGRYESMLEHAKNRQRLIRELRGTQVKVLRLIV